MVKLIPLTSILVFKYPSRDRIKSLKPLFENGSLINAHPCYFLPYIFIRKDENCYIIFSLNLPFMINWHMLKIIKMLKVWYVNKGLIRGLKGLYSYIWRWVGGGGLTYVYLKIFSSSARSDILEYRVYVHTGCILNTKISAITVKYCSERNWVLAPNPNLQPMFFDIWNIDCKFGL